jgi:hypothetical protein
MGTDARHWSNIKCDLDRRVGWWSEKPELRDGDARNVAYAECLRRFENAGGSF